MEFGRFESSTYGRWDLPAQGWSGAEYGEETIRLNWNSGEWSGHTEANQCVRRDLTTAEIVSIRREFSIPATRAKVR